MIEIFRTQAKIKYLKKLEVRIAPAVSGEDLNHFNYTECRKIILIQLYEQLYNIFLCYRDFILETIIGKKEILNLGDNKSKSEKKYIYEKIKGATTNIPNVGIVFHYLKNEYIEDKSDFFCWKRMMKSGERGAFYSMQRRAFVRNIALAIEEIRQTIPKIDKYIVGIDVASDENAEEPWMFAAAYKLIRSHNVTKPVIKVDNGKFERIQNIGFTCHVGEDFRHIVSGLRHIDEVIEEFGYKTGDRLGHALALGINIEQWIYNNEVIAIPTLEHMENLLWIWGISVVERVDIGINLEILEQEIIEIAEDIYSYSDSSYNKNATTISVRLLYQAYKEKFSCFHEEIAWEYMKENTEHKQKFCHWDICEDTKHDLWTKEKLLLTNYCPVFQFKYQEIRLVHIKKDDEMIYRKLQNYIVKKVEKKGIYIETNPTSNLTIGDFSYMSQHPIFELNQNSGELSNHVMVTINSDDPSVFNTNVENELAYIYYAAEAKGYGKEEILSWIEKIRQHGMNASFIQEVKKTETIFNEVEQIIESIRKILWSRGL